MWNQQLDFNWKPYQAQTMPQQDNSYSLANTIFNHLRGSQPRQIEEYQNKRLSPYLEQQQQRQQLLYGYPQEIVPRGNDINPYGKDIDPLMALLRKRESGNNHKAINSLGYLGSFQMGAPLLEDLGLLKKGSSKIGNAALNDPSNWQHGLSKEAFLNNPELQENVMKKALDLNRRRLEQAGLINENTDPRVINAMLAASHLGGIGGVKALKKGHNRRDNYGTSLSEYYNIGYNA